jgi:hypothetical protein
MQRVTLSATYEVADRIGAEVWLVLDGIAELRTATGYSRSFKIGETVLIPASADAPNWVPDSTSSTLLRVRVPLAR